MNGLEALKALKEGKTIVYKRDKHNSSDDSFFVYRNRIIGDDWEGSKKIWCRFRNEWTWEIATHPATFWMKATGFEIVEGEE